MSECPYCRAEKGALETINLELLKVIEQFAKGQISFRTQINEPVDAERWAAQVKHVSEAAAAATVRLLFSELGNRADLYRELARYKMQLSPFRDLG